MDKVFQFGKVFTVTKTNELLLPGSGYVRDDEIISPDGTIPYITALGSNNGVAGYSCYPANNKGDCVTISTTARSAATAFYRECDFIGRRQISAIRRRDGQPMGRQVGLYLVTVLRRMTKQFNYENKLTNKFLLDSTVSLPVLVGAEGDPVIDASHFYHDDGYVPDWDNMRSSIAEREKIAVRKVNDFLSSCALSDCQSAKDDEAFLTDFANRRFEKFFLSDFFEIAAAKRFDKQQLHMEPGGSCDFIGRTSDNYGIQGHLYPMDFPPNPAQCFSLVQIGETVALWREREWYASQNIFILQPKYHFVADCFLFFQTAINKEMSTIYGSDYKKYPTLDSLAKTKIILPVLDIDCDESYDSEDGFTPDIEFIIRYTAALMRKIIPPAAEFVKDMLQDGN